MDRKMSSGFFLVCVLALLLTTGTPGPQGVHDPDGVTNSGNTRSSVDPNGRV